MIPYEVELRALHKEIVSARFWHAAMAACEDLVEGSHKTLDDAQKARAKDTMEDMKSQRAAPEKGLRLQLFEYGGSNGAVDAVILADAFPGLHAGAHMVTLFRSLACLSSSENFVPVMIKFHKASRMWYDEAVRNCATRWRAEAQSAVAPHHAYGQLAEHYGYAVNEHGALLMLIWPWISRRMCVLVFS